MSAPATRRVRKLWLATRENGRLLSFSTSKANNDYLDPFPVYVLYASPAAMEGYVEAMADALMPYLDDDQIPASAARAALAALLRARR